MAPNRMSKKDIQADFEFAVWTIQGSNEQGKAINRWKCYKLAYEVGLDICTNFSEKLSDQKVSGIL